MNSTLPIVSNDSTDDAVGRWWTAEADGRVECHLCPRHCRLNPGDRGFCFVRLNRSGRMVLDTYGRSTGFCIDPIEKKPLNHFLPGTPVLSFGTAGCNLGCKFCQNWDISKSREVARLSDLASPSDIAHAAFKTDCRSVAFTYNDPVIWAEYAIDTARECRQLGLKTVAVTAGYITPDARGEFFESMDAANIDLKAFTESFYFKLTGAHLDSVLDTIRYVCKETDCWVELTNLVIPDANDHPEEFKRMCDWVLETVGADVPVHFTAFHPDFRMMDRPATPAETLNMAHDLARQAGLRYVYVGNVHDVARQSTFCSSCGKLLIERDWHQVSRYELDGNRCRGCGHTIPGYFEDRCGTWGRRRQPIRIMTQSNIANSSRKESNMSTSGDASDVAIFSQEELIRIHDVACRQVEAAVNDQPCDTRSLLEHLAQREVAGIYVTLKRGETLRGCCGLQGPAVALADALADAAVRTAKHDPRMAPVTTTELPYLNLSISILGPPRPIAARGDARIDAVQVGQHGLRISMAGKAGLLLPVVAEEQGWNSRQFLDAICSKAGLPPGSWRSDQAVVEVFDGLAYGNQFCCSDDLDLSDPILVNPEDLARLARWTQRNIQSMINGATPFYYADDVADRAVQGIVLRVFCGSEEIPFSWLQLTIQNDLPLQSTLFQMTQNAVRHWIDNPRLRRAVTEQCRAELGILGKIIHHGMAEDYDLKGIDSDHRALLAMEGRRWSLTFDPNADSEAVLTETLKAQAFRRERSLIYSAHCDATDSPFAISMGPQAEPRVANRSPAVAGTFYPADDHERESLVDDLLQGLPKVRPGAVEAAMVPHAGLHYSGQIAADVWRRIKIPESVLIIGPKHTAEGVDWAVAPHDVWKLSDSASLAGDVELSQRIAEAVPGMQLDAGAHAREHGIEVQLPILHRLAPQVRIAAIAMADATWTELEKAAQALADLFTKIENPPLLVISSDMNHFADDVENRRRDRLALDALKKNEPRTLLEICAEENISMCGKIPAALVLMTLNAMKKRVGYQEIGYATSGDVSKDRSRVVGYAGVLFS